VGVVDLLRFSTLDVSLLSIQSAARDDKLPRSWSKSCCDCAAPSNSSDLEIAEVGSFPDRGGGREDRPIYRGHCCDVRIWRSVSKRMRFATD